MTVCMYIVLDYLAQAQALKPIILCAILHLPNCQPPPGNSYYSD